MWVWYLEGDWSWRIHFTSYNCGSFGYTLIEIQSAILIDTTIKHSPYLSCPVIFVQRSPSEAIAGCQSTMYCRLPRGYRDTNQNKLPQSWSSTFSSTSFFAAMGPRPIPFCQKFFSSSSRKEGPLYIHFDSLQGPQIFSICIELSGVPHDDCCRAVFVDFLAQWVSLIK